MLLDIGQRQRLAHEAQNQGAGAGKRGAARSATEPLRRNAAY